MLAKHTWIEEVYFSKTFYQKSEPLPFQSILVDCMLTWFSAYTHVCTFAFRGDFCSHLALKYVQNIEYEYDPFWKTSIEHDEYLKKLM